MEIIPVIHVVDYAQTKTNLEICNLANIKRVFLINHQVSFEDLLLIVHQTLPLFSKISFGINGLGEHPKSLLQKMLLGVDAIWFDETITDDIVKDKEYKGDIFGGLAFKYQKDYNPIDLQSACEQAKRNTTVAVTSGPGTGKPANIEKIKRIKEFLGDHPLAIASGVDENNIESYKPYADYIMVASSITGPHEIINPIRLAVLKNRIN